MQNILHFSGCLVDDVVTKATQSVLRNHRHRRVTRVMIVGEDAIWGFKFVHFAVTTKTTQGSVLLMEMYVHNLLSSFTSTYTVVPQTLVSAISAHTLNLAKATALLRRRGFELRLSPKSVCK